MPRGKVSCERYAAGADYVAEYCLTVKGKLGPSLRGPEDAVAFMHSVINVGALDREKFWSLVVNAALRPVAVLELFAGGASASVVEPRYVMQMSLRVPFAHGVFLFHNHPSERPDPSVDDLRVTKKLQDACMAVGLMFCDHIILTRDPKVFRQAA